MDWILIPGWARFQHYGDRDPTWIKVYIELRNRDDWRHLTVAQRGLLVCIWLEYAASHGQLRTSDLPGLLLQKLPRKSIQALSDAGLIELSSSRPSRARAGAPSKEKEKEEDLPKKVSKPKPARITGWRLVRGSHGTQHVPDPNGTDRPPADAALKEMP